MTQLAIVLLLKKDCYLVHIDKRAHNITLLWATESLTYEWTITSYRFYISLKLHTAGSSFARFLPRGSRVKQFRILWIDVYLGFSDHTIRFPPLDEAMQLDAENYLLPSGNIRRLGYISDCCTVQQGLLCAFSNHIIASNDLHRFLED